MPTLREVDPEDRDALHSIAGRITGRSQSQVEVSLDLYEVRGTLDRTSVWLSHAGSDWSWWLGNDGLEHDLDDVEMDLERSLPSRVPRASLVARSSVLRIIVNREVLDLSVAASRHHFRELIPQTLTEVPGTDLLVLRRPYVKQTLADLMDGWMAAGGGAQVSDTDMTTRARTALLISIASSLRTLHSDGAFHGDLRPPNISVERRRHAVFFDYGIRRPLGEIAPEQQAYVAPEDRSEIGPAADVYAFGKLAQRMLAAELWSDQLIAYGWRASALSWLFEYCSADDPDVRPSMKVTLAAMTAGPEFSAYWKKAVRKVRPKVITWIARSASPGEASAGYSRRYNAIVERTNAHPVTRVALSTPPGAERALKIVDVDKQDDSRQNEFYTSNALEELAANERNFPDSIDERWRARVVRAIRSDADDPESLVMPDAGVNFGISIADARRYREQLRVVEAARRDLLSKDRYLYTADVARLLTTEYSRASSSDIALLREWGDLLSIPDHGRHLYPAFQFTSAGDVRPVVREVNRRFQDEDAWDVLVWWHLGRVSLDGRSFFDVVDRHDIVQLVDRDLTAIGR